MGTLGEDRLLTHRVPVSAALRMFFIATGLFIVVERKQPFRKLQSDVLARGDGSRLVVAEHESIEGDLTWSVVHAAPDGRRFETRRLQTHAAAKRLLARIEAAFVASEPSSRPPD